MTEYFLPFTFFTHKLGAEFGSYIIPMYLTLEEMRKYHPEPTRYVIMNTIEEQLKSVTNIV